MIDYFTTGDITLIHDDFLKVPSLRLVNLIVTSPPYNLDIQYGNYKDDLPYDEYLKFSEEWLAHAYALTKDSCRLCLNIPLCTSIGHQSICADLTVIAKKIGWKHRTTIIWNEQSVTKRTAWGSWLSASAPHVMSPVEAIIVMHKGDWKKHAGGISTISKEEFTKWTIGVWDFNAEKTKIGHPAPFPVDLPERCIKLFSYADDVILDPFVGSGTTLIACLRTGRAGIGVEIDEKYCEVAKNRIMKEIGV